MARVTPMTVFEEETGPLLELPAEPTELRAAVRDALLDGRNWRDGLADELCIGIWLWDRWRPALEPVGVGQEQFFDALVANRRELWLWLMGERQWSQFIDGQAGRILRRLPTVPESL